MIKKCKLKKKSNERGKHFSQKDQSNVNKLKEKKQRGEVQRENFKEIKMRKRERRKRGEKFKAKVRGKSLKKKMN